VAPVSRAQVFVSSASAVPASIAPAFIARVSCAGIDSGTSSAKSRQSPESDSAVNCAISRPAGDCENPLTGSRSADPANAAGKG